MSKEALERYGLGFVGLALVCAIVGWVPMIAAGMGADIMQPWMAVTYFSAWPLVGIGLTLLALSGRK